jgi:hypothetical protein
LGIFSGGLGWYVYRIEDPCGGEVREERSNRPLFTAGMVKFDTGHSSCSQAGHSCSFGFGVIISLLSRHGMELRMWIGFRVSGISETGSL